MIDFDRIIDSKPAITVTETKIAPPVVTSTVTVTPKPASLSEKRAYLAKTDDQWDWSDLRDYCIAQMERWHGPQYRDFKKEASIFKAFLSRWPNGQAQRIARFAFESQQGMWRSAPITVNRFCRASDEYFAAIIMSRLS
jgi:hypothetical protein